MRDGQNQRDGRDASGARRRVVPAAILLALAAGAIFAPAALGPPWLTAAVTSRLWLICLVVLGVCGAGTVFLGALLWRLGRARRVRPGAQDGAAMIEFAMVLPILLLLSLLMAQTSLLMAGNLCVHYAAFCAARTASVTVPLDYGEDEPRNGMALDGGDSGKLQRIRQAAIYAVMPVSCGSEDVASAGGRLAEGLRGFLSVRGAPVPKWVDDRLERRWQYATDHTEVTVSPPMPDDEDEDGLYEDHEDLHVTVRHTLYLAMPTVSRIFALLPGGVQLDFGDGEYGTEVTALCTMPNEGVQDYVDIEEFPRDAR